MNNVDYGRHVFSYKDSTHTVEITFSGEEGLEEVIEYFKAYLVACTYNAQAVQERLNTEI